MKVVNGVGYKEEGSRNAAVEEEAVTAAAAGLTGVAVLLTGPGPGPAVMRFSGRS